jgi:hypothetical protein
MTIKRPTIGTLYKEQGEAISYCPKCLEHGQRRLMKERVYLPDPLTKKTIIPADANLWRQCSTETGCGYILPVYNLKHEGRLKSELVIQTNPFDKGKTVGIQANRLGKTKRGKNRDEDYFQDEDLKREIREGNQLISYSES